VAKLVIGEGTVCTGFLVAPEVILTNQHCLARSTEYAEGGATPACSDIEVIFDFDVQSNPARTPRSRCSAVLGADETLDYALLKLDSVDAAAGERRVLRLSSTDAAEPVDVFVVHHPAGLAKKVSGSCRLYPAGAGLEEHDCNTTIGSSGAPLLLSDGAVAGLHFDGAYRESMTIREIQERTARGEVFRNKAKPASLIARAIAPLLPAP
jgi:hypothetical protein